MVPADSASKTTRKVSISGRDGVGRADSVDSIESSVSSVTGETSSVRQHHGDKTREARHVVQATLNEVVTAESADGTAHSQSKQELGKSPGEIAFFKLLHAELKKASRFFEKVQLEYAIREERVQEGMEIMKQPKSIMVNEKWSLLAKSIYRLYKDLLLLETFAIMTYCSFSKILKKHDKVTGYNTRAAFMANMVNKANFTNYPKVLEMITRCERMYEEVSNHLLREGKQGLYEDERLFINMISRLNEQVLDSPDGPDSDHGSAADRKRSAIPAARVAFPSAQQQENPAISSLRSLVEENDARAAAAQVSEGHIDIECQPDVDGKKRSATQDVPEAKRSKI